MGSRQKLTDRHLHQKVLHIRAKLLHEHALSSCCRGIPNTDVGWKVNSVVYKLMAKRCTARNQLNEPVESAAANDVIPTIPTLVRHHYLAVQHKISHTSRVCVLAICFMHVNIDFPTKTNAQYRAGLVGHGSDRPDAIVFHFCPRRLAVQNGFNSSNGCNVDINGGVHTLTLSMCCTWMTGEAVKQGRCRVWSHSGAVFSVLTIQISQESIFGGQHRLCKQLGVVLLRNHQDASNCSVSMSDVHVQHWRPPPQVITICRPWRRVHCWLKKAMHVLNALGASSTV